jgi:DNA-binding CsgD family transcriptional regulator
VPTRMIPPVPDEYSDDEIADAIGRLKGAEPGRSAQQLGAALMDLLDRRRAAAETENSKLIELTESLSLAVSAVGAATSTSDLARIVCEQAARLGTAELATFSRLEVDRVVPIAAFDRGSGVGVSLPAGFALAENAAYRRAVISRSMATAQRSDSSDLSVIPVVVDNSVIALVELDVTASGTVSHALAVFAEVVGVGLERLGQVAREAHATAAIHDTARRMIELRGTDHHPVSTADQHAIGRSDRELLSTPLTEREADVARLLLTGASNSTIATELVITIDTVKSHVKSILRKSGTTNRAELIAKYRSAIR